jgi:hypothetical protein
MPVLVSAESGELQSILDWLHGQRQPTPDQYLRGIAFLELLWQQTIPGLSFKVVHDEPDQLPGKSTRTAMGIFAALQRNPGAWMWFVKHIRNAVVHCAAAPDAIAVVGDSIHFYEVTELPTDLGTRLFDRLTLPQRQDFAQLYAGRDAREEFAAFLNSEHINHPNEDHYRRLSEQIGDLQQAHSFTVLLTKTTEADQAGNGVGVNDGDWSDELNERRIELIDKDIQDNITAEERTELAALQRKAVSYRDRIAPLPIEGARRVHQQLLEVKRQRQGS